MIIFQWQLLNELLKDTKFLLILQVLRVFKIWETLNILEIGQELTKIIVLYNVWNQLKRRTKFNPINLAGRYNSKQLR